MNWSEQTIARAIAFQTLAKKCVVLVNNCNWTGYECDVLGVTTDLRIIDVEVKISRADLKADAGKDKWWHRLTWRDQHDPDAPRRHPPKVWKHYYAMPFDIWKPELVDALPSKASGILLLREQRNSVTPLAVHVERRATPNKDAAKLLPEQAVDIARLANIRMWEAYRARDAALKDAEHWRNQSSAEASA